jgi:hypothetical protein
MKITYFGFLLKFGRRSGGKGPKVAFCVQSRLGKSRDDNFPLTSGHK